MYPFTIHCRLCWLKPRSSLIDGRAMLRIDASRMSMNWTRLSRPRIATPRRVDSKDPSGESGTDARSVYDSARIGCSFRSRGSGGYEGVMKRPDRLAARDRVEHEASSVAPVFHLDPKR